MTILGKTFVRFVAVVRSPTKSLQPHSRGPSTADDALISVRANSIEVRSLNAARHAGFFSKRQDW